MSMFAEFFGALLLLVGLFTRWAALLLAFNMLVATAVHLRSKDAAMKSSWWKAAEDGVVFLAFVLIGPGRISLDALLWGPHP